MTPSLRPLQPLLQTTTLRWSSRPRTSHAFQIQQYLLYGTKREEEGYLHLVPYRSSATHKELLRMWRFPRKYKPIYSSIWWTMKWTPRFLKWLIVLGVQYPSWRMQNPRNAVVKSRTGRFFYELVFTQPGFYDLINTTIQPWGFITLPTGTSMQPTFSGNPSISFTSFAYTGIEDVSIGDVVTVLAPDYDAGKGFLGKRVAALDGARIYVAKGPNGTPEIIRIPVGHIFVLGDNDEKSRDSREFGTLPIEAIQGKIRWRWGQDGFQWNFHNRQPWLGSKVIEHLAPGQKRPTQGRPSIKQPQKKPVVVHRPKAKPPPPPSQSPPRK